MKPGLATNLFVRDARRRMLAGLFAGMLAGVVGLQLPAARADELPPPQVSALPVPPGQIDAAIAALDGIVTQTMRESGVPGLAVAVVRDGKTVYAKGFGVRKVGDPAPVDADTVFQLASLSKSITGTVVAAEVGAGRVGWDTPIRKELPWFRLSDDWVGDHVTIGDMLSHRSGLPDHAGDALEDLGFGRRAVLERLRLVPLGPFRAQYAYTNFGFTSAAEATAVAAGMDWESLAERDLFAPLGMSATSARFADFESRANRAAGHVRVGDAFAPKYQRQPDAQSPAGGVSSSVRDMARWMAMVLGGGVSEGRRIVEAKPLLEAMRAEMISAPAFALDARSGTYGYGFGVDVSAAGRVEIQHSGAFAQGAGTNYRLLPSLGVGIVVLTNAQPTGTAEAIAASFMDLVQAGKVSRDWYGAYAPRLAPISAPVGSLVGASPPADPAPAAPLVAYVGNYQNDYYGPVAITLRDNGLVLTIGPAARRYELTHWDGDVFIFHPSSENEPDGSVSLARFAGPSPEGFAMLTIEYLDAAGLGRFRRE